jgi:DNA-binding CsgD family transcriptional regulator
MSDRAIASATFLADPLVGHPVFEFAAASERVASDAALDAEMAKALERFGIQHFVLYQATDHARRTTNVRIAGRSHIDWRRRYVEAGLAEGDDLLRSGLTSRAPTTWRRFRANHPKAGSLVYDEARQFRLHDGFYLPMPQTDGSMLGVSMMVQHKLDPDPRTLAALHLMAHYFSYGAERLGLCPPLVGATNDPLPDLTRRQRECLAWVGAGKSSWEIGEILKLSEHTVNEHLGAARKRLRVHTTTQAVIEAVRRGQIVL